MAIDFSVPLITDIKCAKLFVMVSQWRALSGIVCTMPYQVPVFGIKFTSFILSILIACMQSYRK